MSPRAAPADPHVKRIAVMDSDGNNQQLLTAGDTIVLTPRLSPKGGELAYVSFVGGQAAGPARRPEFRRRSGR